MQEGITKNGANLRKKYKKSDRLKTQKVPQTAEQNLSGVKTP